MKVFFCGGSIAVATPSGIAVFDLATSSTTTLPRRPAAAIIDALALPDNRIAVVYDDKALVIFSHGATGWTAEGDVRTCAKKPTSLALLSAVPAVLVGEMSGDVIAFAASAGRRETRPVLTHTSSGVSTLATSSDGSLLYSGDEDGRIKITRVADLRLQVVCLPLGRSVAAVKALVDVGGHGGCAAGSLLLSAAADSSLSLWDAATGALLGHAEGPAGAESGAAAGGASSASGTTKGGAAAAEVAATTRFCLAGAPGAAATAVAGSPAVRLAVVAQAGGAGGGVPRLECSSLVLDSGAGGGGVQALATAPASAARILCPAATPGDLPAFMLALCGGSGGSSLRLRAFQATPAAVLGGPLLLERTDAEGGSAAARALAAVDWAAL